MKKKEKEKKGGTFDKGNIVNLCHGFFCFNVIFPTSINFVFLVADSASVFELIITVFFSTLESLQSPECCLPFTYCDSTNIYCVERLPLRNVPRL